MLTKELTRTLLCQRPWGFYEVLFQDDSTGYKIKRIRMNPFSRISLQKHHHRTEIWTIIKGTGIVTINGHNIRVSEGDTVTVPVQSMHRIANPIEAPLLFVEVQVGSYLEEDDIERIEDDYDRISPL